MNLLASRQDEPVKPLVVTVVSPLGVTSDLDGLAHAATSYLDGEFDRAVSELAVR